MTSKADQLFLELYLLRLRYSEEDIEQVANLRSMQDQTVVRNIVAALREMRVVAADRVSSKRLTKKPKSGPPRHKTFTGNSRTSSDTEPFLNLAKSLMKR